MVPIPDTSYHLGIDVGGTFADFVLAGAGGHLRIHKELGTPADPAQAVLRGIEALAAEEGLSRSELLARLPVIVHGTTVTTNALIVGGGASTGLLTTAGLRDALEMRRGIKEEAYDQKYQAPAPLVPRYRRLPTPERLDYSGKVLTRLDETAVREAARQLVRDGVEAAAVCFLHSYQNPEHEQAAARILAEEAPGLSVTTSAELVPRLGFYERVSTTVLSAYLAPLLGRYLGRLTEQLAEAGFDGVLLIVSSAGGVMSPEVAMRQAVATIGSGPAAGPVAGARFAGAQGHADCSVVDMGGTSFDASIVRDGQPLVAANTTIDRRAVAIPTVAIHSVGSGGGSIAWLDAGGVLRVGPRSAGAEPGPACYGRGGDRPTVTDADLLLGLLNPDFFLGGRQQLDEAAAERAMRTHLGPLGQDPVAAAAGVYDVVNASMAAALRTVTLQRGVDPRGLPMVVGGGAGPIHAAAIAAELGVQVVLVPRTSSTFCALGTLLLDFRHEYVRSCFGRLDSLDPERVTALCEQIASDGRATLAAEGRDEGSATLSYAADLRYSGQFHEVTVPTDLAELRNGDRAALAKRFHDRHFALYGYASPELPVELVNLRLSVIGTTHKPELPHVEASAGGPDAALKGTRSVFTGLAGEWVETPVYDGLRLGFGDHVKAPALIELPTTTVAVLSPFEVLVDRLGTFTLFQQDAADETRRRILDGR